MIEQSLGYNNQEGVSSITFKYYEEIIFTKVFLESIVYTIYISVVPTLISLILGIYMGIAVHFNIKKKNKLNKIIQIPIIIPYTVYIFCIILILMQTGIVSRSVMNLNIIDTANDFPLLIYDKFGVGIILVYVLKQVPFVYFIIISSLSNMDRKYIDVALNLGSSKIQILREIVLPYLRNSIMTAFFIVFAFNFGSFEAPFLLGNPKYNTLPVLSYKYFISSDIDKRSYSMVINTIMIIAVVILLHIYIKYNERKNRRNYEKG